MRPYSHCGHLARRRGVPHGADGTSSAQAHLVDGTHVNQDVEKLTEGPVRAGTRFREVHEVMGRRRVELTEVVECDPGRLFHIRVLEGPPVDGRWEFAPTPGGGTRVTFTPLAHLSGRARIANRAMEQMTALVFRRFHRRTQARARAGRRPAASCRGAARGAIYVSAENAPQAT
jgi:hypothetical protein